MIASQVTQSSGSLSFKRNFLVFAGEEGDQADGKQAGEWNGVYYKNVPREGLSSDVKRISDDFDSVVAVASLDTFFYIADRELGFYAIEAKSEDTFSEPRKIDGLYNAETGDFMTPTVMISFTLGALHSVTLSLVTLFALSIGLNLV